MADRRRNRSANRSPKDLSTSGPPTMDDETRAALALFNRRLSEQAEADRAQRRTEKAARAKDEAAAHVRALEADSKATVEQRATAAASYRAAVEAWDRARRGDPDTAPEPPEATEPEPLATEPEPGA